MFDIPKPATTLHNFAETHFQTIQNAALLLGGRPWLNRVQRLLADLSQSPSITRRILREATALLSLLALENVHDLESPEAAYFANLDPAAPYVEEICILNEALHSALLEFEDVRIDATFSNTGGAK